MRGVSSFFEYVDFDRARAMPGAIALSGFRPPPFGHLAKGPSAPSLKPLFAAGVDKGALDCAIDVLFKMDSASPPMMLHGGCLRPAVEAAFAALVMHYPQRVSAGEMKIVVEELRSCVVPMAKGVTTSDHQYPDELLRRWSTLIRSQFNVDNMHLTGTGREVFEDGAQQLVATITALGHTVGQLHRELTNVRHQLARNEVAMSQRLQEVLESVRHLHQSSPTLTLPVHTHSTATTMQQQLHNNPTISRVIEQGSMDTSSAQHACAASSNAAQGIPSSNRTALASDPTLTAYSNAASSHSSTIPTSGATQSKQSKSPFGSLVHDSGPTSKGSALKEVLAADYYREYMANCGAHPPMLPSRELAFTQSDNSALHCTLVGHGLG